MQIAGLDLSLTGTGTCMADSETNEFSLHTIGTIKTSPKDGILYARIKMILDKLESLGVFDPIKTKLIAIEDYAFGRADRGILDRAELRGIILWHIQEAGIPRILISPSTVKKWATGKGQIKKDMVPMHVRQKYATHLLQAALEIKDNNQADAIPIGDIGYTYLQWTQGKIAPDKDLLKTLCTIRDSPYN